MENLLTVEQYATRAQLHPDSVRRQLREGRLRAAKKGRVWRIFESELEADTPGHVTPVKAPRRPSRDWEQAAQEMAPVYRESLDNNGDLTAITTASGDFYESSVDSPTK